MVTVFTSHVLDLGWMCTLFFYDFFNHFVLPQSLCFTLTTCGKMCVFFHLQKSVKKQQHPCVFFFFIIYLFSHSPIDDVICHNAPPITPPLPCFQSEALRQVLVNRYYGNFKPGGRRESLTNFSNGPLVPGGQTKTPAGLCLL